MHFAGTTPQSLKFHLINSDADQAVALSIFYHLPQRLDVFYQVRTIQVKPVMTDQYLEAAVLVSLT